MFTTHSAQTIQAAESFHHITAAIIVIMPLLMFAYLLRYLIVETPMPPKSTITTPQVSPYRTHSPPHGWGGEAEPIFYTDDIPQ